MGMVKIYRSSDYGAPAMHGAAGGMLPVLQACLVDGYGEKSVTSLTHSGGVVTCVTAIGHGLITNARQLIAGANEDGYNGEFIITVVDSSTFTYKTTGVTVNTATGTITAKSAPAGWTREFNATNISVFRPGAGARHFLRVDDTSTQLARVVGYENMTGVSTGTGVFPTTTQQTGGLYWRKSQLTTTVPTAGWILIADDRTMYFWVDGNTTTPLSYSYMGTYGFGEFISYKPGDAYNTFIIGDHGLASTQSFFGYICTYYSSVTTSSAFGLYAPRSYTQAGTSVPLGKIGDSSKTTNAGHMSDSGFIYPHPVDGGLWMKQIEYAEGASVGALSVLRGIMRGVYTALHNNPLAHLDMFDGSGDFVGKQFIYLAVTTNTSSLRWAIFDISAEWEY